ncbi:siroheme synthase CysG [Cellvibrio sp. KY-YJ-3]|jgi:uroporphyrin-III C-methyltransferase/precorrin-2 dehydrogenase/sirohydrochlorin ferrochelatase|uniref:siroheme synthase CysG n=1 Tax=Cellvibrio sp. KY-YJ-3 TaxID=454662 RepID=UPI0012471812|nr:siroheme synthase CysG [Cellvibrio sp. KY-YJ-3]QEY13619.1 uroporphyrinogen-III C-methyltransferase [Cellvibrio sp. KY-YJ-3]
MEYFPVFLDLKNRLCLLVGGGDIATRKGRLLSKAGARLRVVAPEISSELRELVAQNNGELHEREYQTSDLNDCVIAIAATDIETLNEQISADAQARNLPVNVVDSPALCTYITPAIIDRSPLVIAISSGGESPVLARLIRAKLETLIPTSYGRLAQIASSWRDRVKARFDDGDSRRRFWEKILQGPAAELALNGQETAAENIIATEIAKEDQTITQGEVYLVGGGPGDPELLTLRALRLMQQADVVLYDRLVSDGVMELVRRDAERIYVGKRRSEHAMEQENINQLLVDLAKEGKRVLRLKGGDPFIFGRGGEEIELLAQNNIPFQVVPGITAASGCSAYAGIPLTHRDYAQSVRFVTGHLKSDNTNLQWPELANPTQTLVFYMGLVGLKEICESLISHGRSPQTPVALIEKGTTQEQRVLIADLQSIADVVAANDVHAPTLFIVGEVVKLHDSLKWFNPA